MSMEDLIIRLWIEEDNRDMRKNLNRVTNVNGAKANVVEVKKDFKKGKQPHNWSKLGPKGEKLYMRNVSTSKIKRKGTVVLKMTFSKEFKLQNVLYVPSIH
ncbi:hypothetical protein J1N35_010111 [Gossypium stocksii]|uniref:Retrovirus-related Pol polyprotein from transposon TNT 1-94-like beta-barrel domain-containing protein n=1 Tax=Gossypium stocksii TaxID=47602 RepID=A0A9D3W1C5_9ROSI|nr:hypothetical protein J1N35_010111 [Gossypium stocksii]